VQHESRQQPDEEEVFGPSKSELKRQATALQKLGEDLVALDPELLDTLPIGEALTEAVRLARRIKAHGGRRRQMQYIGKLMRDEDADAIRAALERVDPTSPRTVRVQHQCETWRGRLIEEGDDAVTAFVHDYPHADVQALRQRLRMLKREREKNAPPRHFRELFRELRDIIEQAPE